MKTTYELLVDLVDRDAIRELPLRYCDAIWRNDGEAVVEMFTSDGVMIIEGDGGRTIRGQEALRETYLNLEGNGQPRPFSHNHVIELCGDMTATGRVCVELRRASENMAYWASGYYRDRYQKVDGSWKFAERRLTLYRQNP